MSFFSLVKKHQPKDVSLLLDICSDGVAGAITIFAQDQLPRIVCECREEVPFQKEVEAEKVFGLMIAALEKVLVRMEKEGLSHLNFTTLGTKKVKHVHCTFSSPWYVSQTKILKVKKPAPIAITQDFISNIVELEKKAFIQSLKGGTYAENFQEKLELIESKTISVKLNGYETAKPQGKMASEVEIALYLSIAGSSMVAKIKEMIEKRFRGVEVIFHTFPIVAFSAIRDLPYTPPNFLHVDIAAEVTDLTVVKKGVAIQTITVPQGKNAFIRTVAKVSKTTVDSAPSLFMLYAANSIASESKSTLDSALQKTAKEWQVAVSESLMLLSEDTFIPGSVYITVDEGYGEYFTKLISDQSLGRGNSDGSPFMVTVLNRAFLKSRYQIDPQTSDDPFLVLQALFINKIYQK